MKNSKLALFALFLIIAVFFVGCGPAYEPELETYSFSELANNDIFLVKTNRSNTIVQAGHTGGSRNLYPQNQYNPLLNQSDVRVLYSGHPAATEFNANPPAITSSPPRITRSSFTPPEVGATRQFLVESFFNSGVFVDRTAILEARGTHGNIWVINSSINRAQAEEISAKFDIIYDRATDVLGYEYGKYDDQEPDGKDNDPRIQILVYNIGNNIAGYFWAKDFYTQTELTQLGVGNLRTNLAEIFYLDAGLVTSDDDYDRNFAYLTLAHELQHMINFNRKFVRNAGRPEVWYNELLSKMTEDIIAPILGIDAVSYHIPWFNALYDMLGVTDWNDTSGGTLTTSSYVKSYAFGAFLMRNYGGAELLKNILDNNFSNIQSLTSALGMSFEQVLLNYGQAMIYSDIPSPDDNRPSFNRSVTKTIGGRPYALSGINIWDIERKPYPGRPVGIGPFIFNLTPTLMRPHSIIIQSTSAWRNLSGNFSITLELPRNSNVELNLLVR